MEASALHAPVGLARQRSAIGLAVLRLRSDEQLVSLLRAGHEEAFQVIYDRYRVRLFAYMRQMLPQRQDVEDAMQEVFERAYASLRHGDRELAVRPWLYRIAHNRCVDQLRRPVPPAPELMFQPAMAACDPVLECDRREAVRRLMSDVGRLPEQQRSALLMRELGGTSYAEVAAALGVSVPAVKSLLVRARIALVQAGEARDVACEEIRAELVLAHESRARPNAMARRHLRDCTGCREFRGGLRGVRRQLLALGPSVGPVALLARLLGGGGAGGSGAAAACSGSAAGGVAGAGAGASGAGGLLASAGALASSAGHVATLIAATVVAATGAAALQHSAGPQRHHGSRPPSASSAAATAAQVGAVTAASASAAGGEIAGAAAASSATTAGPLPHIEAPLARRIRAAAATLRDQELEPIPDPRPSGATDSSATASAGTVAATSGACLAPSSPGTSDSTGGATDTSGGTSTTGTSSTGTSGTGTSSTGTSSTGTSSTGTSSTGTSSTGTSGTGTSGTGTSGTGTGGTGTSGGGSGTSGSGTSGGGTSGSGTSSAGTSTSGTSAGGACGSTGTGGGTAGSTGTSGGSGSSSGTGGSSGSSTPVADTTSSGSTSTTGPSSGTEA